MNDTELTLAPDPADETLRRRTLNMASAASGADWRAVEVRAAKLAPRRNRRRRVVVLGVTAAGLALVVAPAFALRDNIVDYFAGPPAPGHVVQSFADLDRGAPPGMAPNVVASEAREVKTFPLSGDKTSTLWVAPTKGGGFCDLFSDVFTGCRSAAENSATSKDVIAFGVSARRSAGPIVVAGDVDGRSGVEKLEVVFQDGDRAEIPLTWIGPPVDAAFYLYAVPASKWKSGHRPARLIASDASGAEVASEPLPTSYVTPN